MLKTKKTTEEIGDIAENLVKAELEAAGFKVWRPTSFDFCFNEHMFGSKDSKNYISKQAIIDAIQSINPNLLVGMAAGLPDFVCLKDGKFSFVEVKANKSHLKPRQIETIKKLKEKGYEVIVRRPNVE